MKKGIINIEAIEWKNVDGKATYYLRFLNEKNEFYTINIGKETYENVSKLIRDEEKTKTEGVSKPSK